MYTFFLLFPALFYKKNRKEKKSVIFGCFFFVSSFWVGDLEPFLITWVADEAIEWKRLLGYDCKEAQSWFGEGNNISF